MTVFTKLSLTCQIHGLNEIFEKYFPGVTDGVFVEVGGNDGYSWSNTWGLAEIGWTGIYYEPVHDLAEKCRVRHAANKVRVIETAVGAYDGEIRLYSGQSVTTSLEVAKNDTFGYGNRPEKFTVSPVVSLNQSFKKLGWPNKFELLVIDVDGDEPGVLLGLDLAAWKPEMIIIEASKDHPNPAWRFNAEKIDQMLSKYYEEIHHDAINSIYIRRKDIVMSLFEIKRDLILRIAGWYGCKIFVETGTGNGDTLNALHPYFEQVHSVELAPDLYRGAVNKFRSTGTVHLYQGDSGEVIKQILPQLTTPALIYLDAHYCAGPSARGSKDTPILAELHAILTDPKFRHVILIDDLDQFGKGDYPKIPALKEYVNGLHSGLKFETIQDGKGMILITPVKLRAVLTRTLKPHYAIVPPVVKSQLVPEVKDDSHKWERGPILYGPYREGGK